MMQDEKRRLSVSFPDLYISEMQVFPSLRVYVYVSLLLFGMSCQAVYDQRPVLRFGS